MTRSGLVTLWLLDGVVRHRQSSDSDLSDQVDEAAQAAVDNLGAVPMIAVVEVNLDGFGAVVRSINRPDDLGDTGPVAEAVAPALKRALAIRPDRSRPLTIEATAVVLLAVRLRSRGTESDIASTAAALASAPIPGIATIIASLANDGLVRSRGEAKRISLTVAGTARLDALMAESADGAGRGDIEVIYREFLVLNRAFLSVVSAWQTGAQSTGDAAGAALRSLVDQAAPILVSLSRTLPRFRGYLPRFDRALGRAEGRTDWLDSPVLDSVHTVWFELHEHLLATLGRSRTDEQRHRP